MLDNCINISHGKQFALVITSAFKQIEYCHFAVKSKAPVYFMHCMGTPEKNREYIRLHYKNVILEIIFENIFLLTLVDLPITPWQDSK